MTDFFADMLGALANGGPSACRPAGTSQLLVGEDLVQRHRRECAEPRSRAVNNFFDDTLAAEIDNELELVRALRHAPVRQLALRVADLSPEGLAEVTHIVE